MLELNKIYNEDCLEGMKRIPNGSIDCVITDIPYGGVNRESNGLRNLDKENADIVNFNVAELTSTLCDKSNGSVYMFCGFGQLSTIYDTMTAKGLSTRIIVWEKTNPSPMNGDFIWLSGVELCVFGRKKNSVFNYHCKNSVLRFPSGINEIHPTQKPVDLIRTLALASTNMGGGNFRPIYG